MTDISLHELKSELNSKSFECFSNEISRHLLNITTQLRSVDKQINILERHAHDNNVINYDEIETIEIHFTNIGGSIDDLNDDIKDLEKISHIDSDKYRYRDDNDNNSDYTDNEDDKRKHLIVEKLGKGVNETRILLEKMQATVLEIKKHPLNSTDILNLSVNNEPGDNQALEDTNTSRGMIGGKVFQIQHTPLNAEQIEAQHYEAIQREAEINKIVNSVGELNQIFHDMDTLVNNQGELVDNIESNIYSTLENTRYADRELRKADSWDRKRRRFSCVLIVVVIIVMFILLALIS
ncbi:hypothetical protein C6P40_002846 [Pichia californica]|uniref:t-SNARE coiled-coil homology domain-containing protein n=1 Tax=Pichia californica TaxID=460514 RepID=A0A9P6WNQ9_9ASCO|nr:hypothetical protein C6P42_004466 [[Candida] californica]KAG0690471.1 hypothetical protein C6P40_002846 [[Candida] californica]